MSPAASTSESYVGQNIALATMHGKERAVGKAFVRQLSATIVVPKGIDTDRYGTFTGEIPRHGTMLDAARAKALAAIEHSGLPYAIASEGAFGPHRLIPLIPAATETLVLVDRARNREIVESIVTPRTNFSSRTFRPGDPLDAFLHAAGFPRHAVVIGPNIAPPGHAPIKGVTCPTTLADAIRLSVRQSADGTALVVTDMRAHVNPTRMAVIRALAHRLARRLSTACPRCATPGFGRIGVTGGLPCGWCGEPTAVADHDVWRCSACGLEARTKRSGMTELADPAQCHRCNP